MFRKKDFERRIFLLFFLYTFVIVIILTVVAWQLARYGINQAEDLEVDKILIDFSILLEEETLNLQNALNELTKQPEIIAASAEKNTVTVEAAIEAKNLESLVVFDRERNLWFGENWELIQKYLPQIYQNASQTFYDTFLGAFNEKLYLISFSPCISVEPNSELLSIFIVTKQLNITDFPIDTQQDLMFFTFQNLLEPQQNYLSDYSEKLVKLIEEVNPLGNREIYTRLGVNYSAAMKCFFDLQKNPTGVFLIFYHRHVNTFAQQSIILFILILLAFTLLIVGFLGNWFSKTIISPVKEVSNKMKEIAMNPSAFQNLLNKYDGVLGDMANSFNIMNDALAEHSKTLRDYKLITDNIETGIFWLDNEFNILLCNHGFQNILEIDNLNKIIGNNISHLLGLDDKLRKRLIEGSITIPSQKITVCKSTKYVILNIRPDEYEDSVRFFGSITDITKEINAITAAEALEIELIKSNKLAVVGSKVEGIVHNLNSPLNSILGYAQLIKKGNRKEEDIDKIIEAGKNAARMIRGLLDKVKKSNTGMIRPIDISDVVQQELDLCEHNLFFKHYVILDKKLAEDLPEIKAIYGDISLCIANLLNNAFDAMQDSVNKNLRVETYSKDSDIFIEIEDSGVGIPESDFENIFNAYYSTKSDNHSSGFGLGLAISKSVIEKYNGSIRVDSKLGVGTTFTIKLPFNNDNNKE